MGFERETCLSANNPPPIHLPSFHSSALLLSRSPLPSFSSISVDQYFDSAVVPSVANRDLRGYLRFDASGQPELVDVSQANPSEPLLADNTRLSQSVPCSLRSYLHSTRMSAAGTTSSRTLKGIHLKRHHRVDGTALNHTELRLMGHFGTYKHTFKILARWPLSRANRSLPPSQPSLPQVRPTG